MKKKILKYKLETDDLQEITMPKGAELLCVKTQYEIPRLYVLADTEQCDETRQIQIIEVGHYIDDSFTGVYVDSYRLNGFSLVFHVFDNGVI